MTPILDPRNGPGRLALELRRARSRRGLTRQELADWIGRSVATVQRAEAGHTRPSWSVVKDIARACWLSIAAIETLGKGASGHSTPLTEAPHLKLVSAFDVAFLRFRSLRRLLQGGVSAGWQVR
ncbi:helix-turn-helix transcriptional regulator [Streptomyces sp. NPDC048415]|uniref:helix-turn-helix domain-containing protein n=1 Tax=Streptomyces sp. NPDC048415 TaxID=3154822 RepID=UPI003448D8A2